MRTHASRMSPRNLWCVHTYRVCHVFAHTSRNPRLTYAGLEHMCPSRGLSSLLTYARNVVPATRHALCIYHDDNACSVCIACMVPETRCTLHPVAAYSRHPRLNMLLALPARAARRCARRLQAHLRATFHVLHDAIG
jgi:hypothetical protein